MATADTPCTFAIQPYHWPWRVFGPGFRAPVGSPVARATGCMCSVAPTRTGQKASGLPSARWDEEYVTEFGRGVQC